MSNHVWHAGIDMARTGDDATVVLARQDDNGVIHTRLFTHGPDGAPVDDSSAYAFTDLGWTVTDGLDHYTREEAVTPPGPWLREGDVVASFTIPADRAAEIRRRVLNGVIEVPDEECDDEFDDECDQQASMEALEDDEYAAVPALPADADLLDRIDALTADLCACGCRRAIPPGGASDFFASPGCQRRWHSDRATDPGDVYGRPDAAPYMGIDQARVPLREPGEPATPIHTTTTRRPAPTPAEPSARLASCADPYGAAYRRQCPHCGHRVIPHVYQEQEDLHGFGDLNPTRIVLTPIRQACPQCEEDLPAPAFVAVVEEQAGTLCLELADGQSRVRRRLPVDQLVNAPDLEGHFARTWFRMEDELVRFRRSWNGAGGNL